MKIKLSYLALHFGIWILIVAMPIYYTTQTFSDIDPNSETLLPLPFWITIGLLIVIFYLNYYIFIPRFLFTKKYVVYVAILVGLFVVFSVAPRFISDLIHSKPPPRIDRDIARRVFPILFSNVFLMYITVFFSSIALRVSHRWLQTEEERHSAQLSYLTSQINPHFLFNTLNSIYGLTIVKAPQAAEMVGKLSEIMRYSLHSSRKERVPLSEEIDYIKNYIELQKIRLDENVTLDEVIDDESYGLEIAPLVLIPFIENAFKYGVNAEQNSNIKIQIKTRPDSVKLTVFNNKVEVDSQNLKKSGLGIENTRKRLDLMYPEKYTLECLENEYEYMVTLDLNLK